MADKDRQFDAELRDLWSRRSMLNNPEWVRLYEIVSAVLANYKPRELGGLPGEHADYVNGFYVDKVMRRDLLSDCYHAGALRGFFKNYLRDELKRQKRRGAHEQTDEQDEDHESSLIDRAADVAQDDPDVLEELLAAGFQPQQIAASAHEWLMASEEWVRIFIAFSNCPDADQSEPLVRLAKRLNIKSQAYKAAQLGFNWRGDDSSGFQGTLLGRWILSVGIEIQPENIHLIHGALKILCVEALTWGEQQEAAE